MIAVDTVRELHSYLKKQKLSPRSLVPTMGALHPGHLSLVNEAVKSCPFVVVSIFVNPAQFNDISDLVNYPRTPAKDQQLLDRALRKNDIVFLPSVDEIYPEEDRREFTFGNLDKVMEGLHRPGHFNGVAKVVTRLFDIIKPDIAFFGQKDLQQLIIIKELVRQTGYPVKIIACPIIRESNGLAMSSRNMLLQTEIREKAGIIFKTLSAAAKMCTGFEITEIKEHVISAVNRTDGFKVEYFEIVDDHELKPICNRKELRKERRYFGCIAVKAGNIRLIDNCEFSLPESKG
jgi:pantoate--beta-alanine ligase